MVNQQSSEEVQKSIIRKFETRKVYSSFKDDIWSAILADVQLISIFNKWICFSYYAVLIFIVNMPWMIIEGQEEYYN